MNYIMAPQYLTINFEVILKPDRVINFWGCIGYRREIGDTGQHVEDIGWPRKSSGKL